MTTLLIKTSKIRFLVSSFMALMNEFKTKVDPLSIQLYFLMFRVNRHQRLQNCVRVMKEFYSIHERQIVMLKWHRVDNNNENWNVTLKHVCLTKLSIPFLIHVKAN